MNSILKSSCISMLFFITALTANAQGFKLASKKKPADILKDTVIDKPMNQNTSTEKSVFNPATSDVTPKKRVDTTTVGGFNAENKRSLRSGSAFSSETISKKSNKEALVLDYQNLREEDALFSEYVWEEIDGREKINRTFLYQSYDESEDQRFLAILLRAIEKDGVMPFSPVDDRFTTPMTLDSVNATIKGVLVRDSAKNVENPDIYDTVYKYKSVLNPDSIYTFRLKVQWVFDSKTSRMYSRIIGIAPIYSEIVNKELSKRTLFWVSYKDLRPSLVKNQVYNPKNMTNRITWDQLFESRYFNSYVVKSTMDNYNDKLLKALYKDPIKRLQEGEKIKQKIFDFEQDRWVY